MKFSSFSVLVFALHAWAQLVVQKKAQYPLTESSTSPSSIPLLGFGTWNLDRSNASDVVTYALKTGYRHIDCAAAYGNQKEVGKGIAEGLKNEGLKRSDIWVTSKLWNDHHRPDLVLKGLQTTLSDLDLDYLDLFLMHWPVASEPETGKTSLSYINTWHAMEALLATGKVKNIGVSNFSPAQISNLISSSLTKPFAHQMELHPYLQQSTWVQWHQAHGIHVTAYSPLANSNPTYDGPKDDLPPQLLKSSVMEDIAEKRGCTPATVALAWGMSRGTSVIPKSAHASRIGENFGSLECDLHYEDFKTIEGLGRKYVHRFSNPSERWGVPLYEGLDGT
ncbi:MAG: hypothetical protein MMC33_006244 [Icmadophila ericetorum]|nr:hypothetical protein [Icmadophila ericetorum]